MQVRRLGSERDTERGPASPPPVKKASLLQRAYNVVTTGHTEGSTVSSVASSTRLASAAGSRKTTVHVTLLKGI